MKRIAVIALVTLVAGGCVTFGPEMLVQSAEVAQNRLLRLEMSDASVVKVEQADTKELSAQSYFFTLFSRELESNVYLPDLDGKTYGSIEPRILYDSVRPAGLLFSFIAGFTLGTSAILGVPFGAVDGALEIEISILDTNKKVIKKYDYVSKKYGYTGLYYGTMDTRVVRVELMKDIIKRFKDDIGKDAAQLNGRLQN